MPGGTTASTHAVGALTELTLKHDGGLLRKLTGVIQAIMSASVHKPFFTTLNLVNTAICRETLLLPYGTVRHGVLALAMAIAGK